MICSTDQVQMMNEIAVAALEPGPAAFMHRHLWDKVHAVVASHGRRGAYTRATSLAPELMLQEIHADLSADGFLSNDQHDGRHSRTVDGVVGNLEGAE